MTYLYAWGPRWPEVPGLTSMGNRKGERCELLVRGGRNSALVRFERDGYLAVISRNALRKVPQ